MTRFKQRSSKTFNLQKYIRGFKVPASQAETNCAVSTVFLCAQSTEAASTSENAELRTTYQNVSFTDNVSSHVYESGGVIDATRKLMDSQDTNLQEFLSRPVKIFEADWGTGTTLAADFDPWTLFFTNPRVSNRLSNYNLLRARLHIKVLVNGNPFQYGRAMLSYLPLQVFDALSTSAALVFEDLVQDSQRPHVFINPTTGEGGEMVLPFFFYKNYLNVVDGDWDKMGQLYLRSINTLKHANGATDSTNITIMAWAEDVSMSVPTSRNASGLSAQSGGAGDMERQLKTDENVQANTKGMISGPATAVAKTLGSLSAIPKIGPYAMASSMVASGVATAAKQLGYSKPTMTRTPDRYVPKFTSNMALTSVPDTSSKLTVDELQEVSVDPAIAGVDQADPLAIANIAQRESLLTKFTWSPTDDSDSLLFNMRVTPSLHARSGSVPTEAHHLPALAAASLPFTYWTGTIKVRFQFVTSQYHRGRIALVYDPYFGTTDEFNVNYLEVIDISEKNDFTVSIGNAQERSFLPILPIVGGVAPANLYGSAPFLDYIDSNGVLSVKVLNELTTPNSTVDNSIEVNVYVSAGDDFEVAVPSDEVSRVVFKSQSGAGTSPEGLHLDDFGNQVDIPEQTVKSEMALGTTNSPALNAVYMGESITSLRPLLKRYNFHAPLFGELDGQANRYFKQIRAAFPFLRGNVPGATDLTSTNAPYNYCNTVMLHYVMACFSGWRGSLRWKYVPEGRMFSGEAYSARVTRQQWVDQTFFDFRTPSPTYTNISQLNYDATSNGSTPGVQSDYAPPMGNSGTVVAHANVNPILEFEMPWYNQYRFVPGKVIDWQNNDDCWTEVSVYTATNGSNSTFRVLSYCAAGDDWQAYFWTGLPRLYSEDSLPAPE